MAVFRRLQLYMCSIAISTISGGRRVATNPRFANPTLSKISVNISNGLEFDCLQTAPCGRSDLDGVENVLLLHGFPERKEFWAELMMRMAVPGYCALACDLHGYSPKASPDDQTMYESDNLRRDVFEIAAQSGFKKFHLVAHDHGAVLGWRMVGSAGRNKIASFSSLAIPHLDAFSHALYGPSAVEWQQVASQYFTMFVQKESASMHGNLLFNVFRCSWGSCFASPSDFQKALWWYNGGFGSSKSKLAMPPSMTVEEINSSDFPHKEKPLRLRRFFEPSTGDDRFGSPAAEEVGNIYIPTLFVCGGQDDAILCSMDWAKATKDYVKADYTYKEIASCGHNLTACDGTEEVFASIFTHLRAHKFRA